MYNYKFIVHFQVSNDDFYEMLTLLTIRVYNPKRKLSTIDIQIVDNQMLIKILEND